MHCLSQEVGKNQQLWKLSLLKPVTAPVSVEESLTEECFGAVALRRDGL